MMMLLAASLSAGPVIADPVRSAPTIPPIQVTLNNGGSYVTGGLVNVRIEAAEDGYLIVFRVDGDGHVRVLFPLDPDGDAFVRGGKEYELRGRGDRSTFLADDRGGTGMIYAALSHQSYVVRDFSANGHWDYDVLRLRDSTNDAENDLTAIVAQMTNRARFDYDAVGYRVQDVAPIASVAGDGYYPGLYDPYYNPRWRCLSCGWGYPGADITLGFGYSPFWDPWLYSPWGYTNGYGYGYGYGYTGNNWWYGGNRDYPVVVGGRPAPPPLPPGTRSRPRAEPPQTITHSSPPPPNDVGRNRPTTSAPPPTSGRTSPPPSASPGTRARPRPNDLTVTMRPRYITPGTTRQTAEPSARPVFRQPQIYRSAPPQQAMPQSRPVYREPPRAAPAPQARTAPPPSRPATSSRPRGGGR